MSEWTHTEEVFEQKDRLYIREFLNQPGFHSTGFIYAVVEDTETDDARWGASVSLTLGDCSKQVSFAFDMDDARGRENTIYKVDLILDTLTRFKEALVPEIKLAEEREAKRDAERARRKAELHATPGHPANRVNDGPVIL
jgi:hypothetical protein